ncbi:MAG: DNA-binding protein [Acidilobus sp.]
MQGKSRVVVEDQGTAEDYALKAILEFNKGFSQVELYATEDSVCKLVETYLIVKERMGEAVRVAAADIGTARPRNRNVSYLSVIIERLA